MDIRSQIRNVKRSFFYEVDDLKRIYFTSKKKSEIVNEKEIRVVGLRRSGNHAIITWIRRHYPEYIYHLNNIPVKQNPYRFLAEHFPKDNLKQEAKGNFTHKNCLIYSYENGALENIADPIFEAKHDIYLGKSRTRTDVLILRDPFNMFASMLAGGEKTNSKLRYMRIRKSEKNISQLWLDYAKEFLGETSYLKNNKLVINYNKWCLEENYRKQISKQLNLEFSDAGFNIVKNIGGGSSFDGTKFSGESEKMDLMNRWKKYVDNNQYLQMFDQQIIDYSERISGHLSGTELLKIKK